MTLPALGMFRHPEGKIHLVFVAGDIVKTMCTRHPLRNGQMVDPDTRLTCGGCLKGGWCRNFSFGRNHSGNLYVSVASLMGGLE
jgi:hypothetical protein